MCPACYSFQEMKIFHPLALTAFCCDIAFSSASCALKSETIQCVNMFGEAGWLSGWGTVLVIKWSLVQALYPVFHWICSWLPQVQLLCCNLYIANWNASNQLGILNILFMFVYNVYLQFV